MYKTNNSKNPTRVELKRIKLRETVLESATKLVQNGDFYSLSMNSVAEQVDISVGSLYQMFSCKEELICCIAIRGSLLLKEMLTRAVSVEGNAREKMVAVHLTHNYYALSQPVPYQAAYSSKMDGISQKICKDYHEELNGNLQDCLNVVAVVVDIAIANNELVLPEGISPVDLVYSFWSLHYGNLALSKFEMFGKDSVVDRGLVQRTFFRAMLDGQNWLPLSADFDYNTSGRKIIEKLGLY